MSDVLIERDGKAGRIRLNRPKALHALTTDMCVAIDEALETWRTDDSIEIVLIDHAEGRGFCAGGDVKAAAASGAIDGIAARAFFFREYRMNHRLFTYAKPVVAFMDGVTMGGGVGVALPCHYRIATEHTKLAMPETAIGLFPDVGGGWYLSRLPGRIGQYLALTGAQLDSADCLKLGLATHYIPAAELDAIKEQLTKMPGQVAPLLDARMADPGEAKLLHDKPEIDRMFAADRFEDVLAALAADPSDFAARTRTALSTKSPQACKVSLRLLGESMKLGTFAQEMTLEYGIAAHVSMRHDFIEGVRALLVDKDHAPRWDPATPEAVTDHLLDIIFAPLPDNEAWTPHD